MKNVQSLADTTHHVPGWAENLQRRFSLIQSMKWSINHLMSNFTSNNNKESNKYGGSLTESVQKSHMSFPPMNMVITFQSLLKSMRCEGGRSFNLVRWRTSACVTAVAHHHLTESLLILSTRTRTCCSMSLRTDDLFWWAVRCWFDEQKRTGLTCLLLRARPGSERL